MPGPILSRVAANHPVIAAMAGAAVAAVVAQSPTPIAFPAQVQMQTDVANTIAANPIAVNNLNAEPLRNSRTFMGGVGALTAGIAAILALIQPAIDAFGRGDKAAGWSLLVGIVFGGGASGSGIFTIVGRVRDNLPPMQFRPLNPLSWLARRPA